MTCVKNTDIHVHVNVYNHREKENDGLDRRVHFINFPNKKRNNSFEKQYSS